MPKKKLLSPVLFLSLISVSHFSFAANLDSLNKEEFIKAFVNKTSVSIGTDNLNGKTINNTFSMYLDNKGHVIGKMAVKPSGEPQVDHGVYSVDPDGTAYMTWQHWDGAKKLCFHVFNTENAYINVGCDQVFHTVFMKADIQDRDHLNY